jgi:hypothetical protein
MRQAGSRAPAEMEPPGVGEEEDGHTCAAVDLCFGWGERRSAEGIDFRWGSTEDFVNLFY